MADATKTCVVCGANCAGKPRVKDPKGRYYCKPCYDDAVARQRAPLEKPTIAERKQDEPDVDLLAQLAAAPLVAAGAEEVKICGKCGMSVPAEAVLCTNCGFNLQTGRKTKTRKSKDKVERDGDGAGSLALMTMLSAPVVGLLAMTLSVIVFFLAKESEMTAALFLIAAGGFGLVMWLVVTVVGFMSGILDGILCLICGLYALYFVYFKQDNGYIRWLYGAALLAQILSYVLIGANPELFDTGSF